MRLQKGLSRLTSSKVVFRLFLAILKQITQSYSSCITDSQQNFEKGKHLENILKLPSSVYDYDVISDSWFLILKVACRVQIWKKGVFSK